MNKQAVPSRTAATGAVKMRGLLAGQNPHRQNQSIIEGFDAG
jgi:hypothetical protein